MENCCGSNACLWKNILNKRKGVKVLVYYQKMTPEGYQKIKTEIAVLKKDRPRRIKILQEARALGDLSENTEYTEAKRDLGHLQSRVRYLEKQLKYAEVVKNTAAGKVDLGKTVTLKFDDDDETEKYEIVGRMEADVAAGKIAFDSPLGQAIMKKEVNTTVNVTAPAGEYHVTIMAIE